MKKEKLEVYKIILHPEIKLIEVIWRGAFTSEEFREGNEEMLYELRLKGISKVIVDMENVIFLFLRQTMSGLRMTTCQGR